MSGSYNAPRSETELLMRQSQTNFLRQGGVYVKVLSKLRADGVLPQPGEYHEYPKMLYIRTGETETITHQTEDVKGKLITWTEERPVITSVTVNSEEEEERVLTGGKTSSQVEEERQALLSQAKARGVKYDPSWSLLRLQRELGVPTGAEDKAAPFDEIENLRQQVERAEEALRLKHRLAELQRELDAPDGPPAVVADDVELMRSQLRDLGVKVDGRWNPARLKQELEAATAPIE